LVLTAATQLLSPAFIVYTKVTTLNLVFFIFLLQQTSQLDSRRRTN
jgi:hypothetical protein